MREDSAAVRAARDPTVTAPAGPVAETLGVTVG